MDKRINALWLVAALASLGLVLYGQNLGGGLQQPSSGGGGGGASTSLRRVTAATDTATGTDGAIICSAASNSVVETLPPSPTQYQVIEMKRVDSTAGNSCSFAANAGQTIEGTNSTWPVPANNAFTLRWEQGTSTWWIF